jgi:hypothetical protein
MEKKFDIAIETIIRLRKQLNFEQDCLVKALQSIPEKYAKKFLNKYVELLEKNHG